MLAVLERIDLSIVEGLLGAASGELSPEMIHFANQTGDGKGTVPDASWTHGRPDGSSEARTSHHSGSDHEFSPGGRSTRELPSDAYDSGDSAGSHQLTAE